MNFNMAETKMKVQQQRPVYVLVRDCRFNECIIRWYCTVSSIQIVSSLFVPSCCWPALPWLVLPGDWLAWLVGWLVGRLVGWLAELLVIVMRGCANSKYT